MGSKLVCSFHSSVTTCVTCHGFTLPAYDFLNNNFKLPELLTDDRKGKTFAAMAATTRDWQVHDRLNGMRIAGDELWRQGLNLRW